jgi:hypothetical protein
VARKADIQKKLKIALDETRMLIMGVQILIGFQLQAIVQESFATLPSSSRICIGVALILMVCTAGLLIAPAAQHRLVEFGEASPRIIAATTRFMEAALLAFALGIALDLYAAIERIAGFLSGLLSGTAAFVVALAFWYGSALIFPLARAKQEQDLTDESEPTPLSTKIDYMLTEARVVLPGVQALLGFQLIAVLTKPFQALPADLKIAHAIGLGMITLAIVLLLAPAAFHRRRGYSNRPRDRLHLRNSGTRGLGPWARRRSHGRNRRIERPTGHRRAHGRDRSRGAIRALVRLAIGDPGASAASNSKAVTMNPAGGSRGVSLPPSGVRPFATQRSISCRPFLR